MKKYIALICASFITFSYTNQLSTFPLWGSTWVVAQDINLRLFPSVTKLAPKKVAKLTFSKNLDSVHIAYANMQTYRDYKGTYDILKEILRQFKQNQISVPTDSINMKTGVLDIQYQPYDDSVFTLHKKMIERFESGGAYECFIRQGGNEIRYFGNTGLNMLYKELKEGSCYSKEKPQGYYVKRATSEDFKAYTIGVEMNLAGKKSTVYLKSKKGTENQIHYNKDVPVQDYLVKETSSVHTYIWEYDYKTDNVGYWQIHIHPEVWCFPRDIETGTPILDSSVKMTFKQALIKKSESLNDKDNVQLSYYRDPYISDSASVMLSFSFVSEGISSKSMNHISLSSAETGSEIDYEHIPHRMYRVKKDTEYATKVALLQLYSESEQEEYLARTLYDRCPNWEFIDELNGNILFKPVGTKGRLKRDPYIDDAIFTYNDCPCRRLGDFDNLTKSQLTRFIYMPPPTCRLSELTKAYEFYSKLMHYLSKKEDQIFIQKKIQTIVKILKKKKLFYDEHPEHRAKLTTYEQHCPDSWITSLNFN